MINSKDEREKKEKKKKILAPFRLIVREKTHATLNKEGEKGIEK